MLWIKLFIAAVFVPLYIIRWSRWLAIVQQREYRLDRVASFLRSSEGIRDLLRLLPRAKDFTRTGFKRPVRTNRILLVGLISLLFMSALYALFFRSTFVVYLLFLSVLYVLLPLVLFMATLPTSLAVIYATDLALREARANFKIAKPIVIGVTGSYGKTSTKLLMAHILTKKYSVFFTPKSHNTRLSIAKAINENYRGQKVAVLEYAAYAQNEIKELTSWFRPNIAVVTGLAPQHLELFGSMENIILAKSELINALDNKSLVFCNGQDEGAVKICKKGGSKNFIDFSGKESVVKLKHIGLTKMGTLTFVWKGHTVVTNLVGTHYLTAVQASIAVAQKLGIHELEIVAALEDFVPTESFVQLKKGSRGCIVVDDGGTSNPVGFEAALRLLSWYKKQKLQTVLITSGIVDLGEESSKIHTSLANKAKEVTDKVLYLGTHGKIEFKKVFEGDLITDEKEVKQFLKQQLNKDDVVLIEGRTPKWVYKLVNV